MTEVNELEGQKLREAIAKAKGWEPREDKSGAAYWHTQENHDVHSSHLPQWDVSLQAAFGLIEMFHYIHYNFPGDKMHTIIIDMQNYHHKQYTASAPTLPLAICRAWLAMKQAEAVTT